MKHAFLHLHDGIHHILPIKKRRAELVYPFKENPSLKHLVESLGIPHTEIGMVEVNGSPADLDRPVADGDRVDLYPASPSLPAQNGEPRFVVDTHLGKLSAYLRMLGFDTLYRRDFADEEMARISSEQGRILLTRDRGLLKRKQVTLGFCVIHGDPRHQIVDVLDRFQMYERMRPFSRCVHCNTPLQDIAKEAVLERLAPNTRQFYDAFRICPNCRQIYWEGSHTVWMRRFIDQLLADHPGEEEI